MAAAARHPSSDALPPKPRAFPRILLGSTAGGAVTTAEAVTAPDGLARTSATADPSAKPKGHGGRYKVPTGAYFNNPRGGWDSRLRIERQVVRAIHLTHAAAAEQRHDAIAASEYRSRYEVA